TLFRRVRPPAAARRPASYGACKKCVRLSRAERRRRSGEQRGCGAVISASGRGRRTQRVQDIMRTTANESRASAPAPRAARGSVAAARLLVRENPAVVTAWCALVLVVLAAGGTFYAARAYLLPIV